MFSRWAQYFKMKVKVEMFRFRPRDETGISQKKKFWIRFIGEQDSIAERSSRSCKTLSTVNDKCHDTIIPYAKDDKDILKSFYFQRSGLRSRNAGEFRSPDFNQYIRGKRRRRRNETR